MGCAPVEVFSRSRLTAVKVIENYGCLALGLPSSIRQICWTKFRIEPLSSYRLSLLEVSPRSILVAVLLRATEDYIYSVPAPSSCEFAWNIPASHSVLEIITARLREFSGSGFVLPSTLHARVSDRSRSVRLRSCNSQLRLSNFNYTAIYFMKSANCFGDQVHQLDISNRVASR